MEFTQARSVSLGECLRIQSLAPLFSISINKTGLKFGNCKRNLYADDSIIYCIAPTAQRAINDQQLGFNSIQESFTDLKLVSNEDTTKFMFFSKLRTINSKDLQICILKGGQIEQVSYLKYLGICTDDCLSLKNHIDSICRKVRNS